MKSNMRIRNILKAFMLIGALPPLLAHSTQQNDDEVTKYISKLSNPQIFKNNASSISSLADAKLNYEALISIFKDNYGLSALDFPASPSHPDTAYQSNNFEDWYSYIFSERSKSRKFETLDCQVAFTYLVPTMTSKTIASISPSYSGLIGKADDIKERSQQYVNKGKDVLERACAQDTYSRPKQAFYSFLDQLNTAAPVIVAGLESSSANDAPKQTSTTLQRVTQSISNEQECDTANNFNPYLFMTTAGLDPQNSDLGKALFSLLKNGNFNIEKKPHFTKNHCIMTLTIRGTLLGNSYQNTLTGEVMNP